MFTRTNNSPNNWTRAEVAEALRPWLAGDMFAPIPFPDPQSAAIGAALVLTHSGDESSALPDLNRFDAAQAIAAAMIEETNTHNTNRPQGQKDGKK